MRCPKCDHEQIDQVECEACGLIFAKYKQIQARQQEIPGTPIQSDTEKSGGLFKVIQVVLLILATAAITYYFFGPKKETLLTKMPDVSTGTGQEKTAGTIKSADRRPETSAKAGTEQTPIEKARNATVSIDTPWGTGSGFFIKEQYIVTNKHVVEFDPKTLTDIRNKIGTSRKLVELEKQKIRDIRKRMETLPEGPERKQMALIAQSMQEKLDKIIPRLEMDEKKLGEIEGGAHPSDIKIILSDGSEHSANDLYFSENFDLALISLSVEQSDYLQNSPSSEPLHPGDKVYAIGSPVGLRHTVTAGIFSGYREGLANQRFLQTDAAINPGNSGGPLIDEDGYVHGVNTMILQNAEGIGFAIPVELVFAEFDSELY